MLGSNLMRGAIMGDHREEAAKIKAKAGTKVLISMHIGSLYPEALHLSISKTPALGP